MDSIIIRGGEPLVGTINISGSKNACLPIMVAGILTDGILELSNVPRLSDINTMKQLLVNHGAFVQTEEVSDGLTLKIDCSKINNFTAPYDIVRKMRASIWVLGPLLAKYGQAKVSLPGGCAIGARQVDMHIEALKALGAEIEICEGYIHAKTSKGLKGADFHFHKKSVGATINAILAATLADGVTNLSGCAEEPEIVDLCNCLNNMGAKISGIGTEHVTIKGVQRLSGTKHRIIPDRIEAGTYMIAVALSKGEALIKGIDGKILKSFIEKLIEAGIYVNQVQDGVEIKYTGQILPVDITTAPYPGFATDLQAQFMTLMTMSSGKSIISENIFENRFMHVPELNRMGADIVIDGNKAIVKGVPALTGAEVMASDLRASVSLIIAGLVASGETKVRRIYHLDRGYQNLEDKLSKCGARIFRVTGDTV